MINEYYHQEESVKDYIQMAKDVDSRDLVQRFVHFLPKNSNVLELGTGPGTDWKLLNEKVPTTGSDISIPFISYLNASFPEGKFLHLDAISIKTTEKFSGIYANKVLHHLQESELKASLLRQHQILDKNGVVLHSYWKGSGDEVFKGMFVKYYEIDDLQALYTPNYKIREIKSYQEFEPNDSIYVVASAI